MKTLFIFILVVLVYLILLLITVSMYTNLFNIYVRISTTYLMKLFYGLKNSVVLCNDVVYL